MRRAASRERSRRTWPSSRRGGDRTSPPGRAFDAERARDVGFERRERDAEPLDRAVDRLAAIEILEELGKPARADAVQQHARRTRALVVRDGGLRHREARESLLERRQREEYARRTRAAAGDRLA